MRSMNCHARLTSCCAFLCVWVMSGFAQSDPNAPAARSSFNVARVYTAADNTPDSVGVPANLTLDARYSRLVAEMLSRSATFRRQCHRMAWSSHLSVVVERTYAPTAMTRASATITRSGPAIRALVRIAADADAPELIAHELEHVIEYLDDVDLAAKARLHSTGVYRCLHGDAAYETERAVHVGKRVARELRDAQ